MTIADWPNAKRSLDAYDLTGKRALVVGAARGVGRAIALALAEAGADLALCTTTTAGDETVALRKVAREMRELGRAAIEQSIDASLGTGAQVMVKQVLKELGRIDVLVNAPDAFVAKPATRVSDADWAKTIGANLGATFYACRAAGRVASSTSRRCWASAACRTPPLTAPRSTPTRSPARARLGQTKR